MERSKPAWSLEAAQTADDDAAWARTYCAYQGLRYLSHERYGDRLKIAVEAPGERYEIEAPRCLRKLDQK